MDPNANLKEQAELLGADNRPDLVRRADLRRALREWLAGGGFEPAWADYPDAAKAYRKWVRMSARFQDLYR